MTPELWQRLKPLFHAALEKGPPAALHSSKVPVVTTSN